MNLVGSCRILIEPWVGIWWIVKEANETLGLNYGNGFEFQNA